MKQLAWLGGVFVGTAVLLSGGTAEAQPETYSSYKSSRYQDEKPDRDGLSFGLSFGRGSIDVNCDDCDLPEITEALSVAGHVGYFLTPRVAVQLEHWSVRYNVRGGAWFDDGVPYLVAQQLSLVGVQAFATESIWVKAGFGVGWHITDRNYAKPRGVPAAPIAARGNQGRMTTEPSNGANMATYAAIGWEFAHNRVFGAEVQFRVGSSRRADGLYTVHNTGLNVGATWY